MKYTYLLTDFLTILIPFIASFHPRARFYKSWKAYWPASLMIAAVFIAWDMLYTHWHVWGFNQRYLCGAGFLNLPLEEMLFFICIPYACIFSYHCLTEVAGMSSMCRRMVQYITWPLCGILLVSGLLFADRLYTSVTFIALSTALWVFYSANVPWLGRFYKMFLVMIPPFLLVNGLLTSMGLPEPVVWYNDDENMGLRLLTIPVEDVFYGMLLLLLNLALYEKIRTLFSGKLATAQKGMKHIVAEQE